MYCWRLYFAKLLLRPQDLASHYTATRNLLKYTIVQILHLKKNKKQNAILSNRLTIEWLTTKLVRLHRIISKR
jgi:hypothetical protein